MASMRILVDFTQIPVGRTGAGIYAENLVREIPSLLGPDDLLFLLVQRDELILPSLFAQTRNVRILFISSHIFRNRLLLMLFEQFIFPWLLLVHHIDVLHSLHYTLPLWSPAARVVTFHDLTMLLWPQLHTRGRRLVMPIYMRLAWHLADGILFVSAATQRDAERLLGPRGKLRAVSPLGVNSDSFVRPSENQLQQGLSRLQIDRPYLLFVGTIEPRKNLVRLIHAFEIIAPLFPEHILVLAGKLGWDFDPVLEAIAASPLRGRMRHLGYISEEDKRTLLAGCAVLVYPSLYEGFGLPVLEAMAAGAPVITSNVSSLPEVAGDAALLVDPTSVDQIASAIRRLLGDPALAQHYRTLGSERAKIFSWSRTAAETYKIYETVLKTSPDH